MCPWSESQESFAVQLRLFSILCAMKEAQVGQGCWRILWMVWVLSNLASLSLSHHQRLEAETSQENILLLRGDAETMKLSELLILADYIYVEWDSSSL